MTRSMLQEGDRTGSLAAGFNYKFIEDGHGHDDIEPFSEAGHAKRIEAAKAKKSPAGDLKMPPLNDSFKTSLPRSRKGIDKAVMDYYARNTYLRFADTEEDPHDIDIMPNHTLVKEVRNVHINSEHQRVYVWTVVSQQ
jgi:hypothetical protein